MAFRRAGRTRGGRGLQSRVIRLLLLAAPAGMQTSCGIDRVQDVRAPVRLAEVRRVTLDSIDTPDALADIERLSDSALVFSLDHGSEIVMVSWSGASRRRIARKGRGPGEVELAGWLARSDDGTLLALDPVSRRITRWSNTGEFQFHVSLEVPAPTGLWSAPGGIVVRASMRTGGAALYLLDAGAKPVSVLPVAATHGVERGSCSYCPVAVSNSGVVAWAPFDTSYLILVRSLAGDSITTLAHPGVAAVRRSTREADSVAKVWASATAYLAGPAGASAERVERFRARAARQVFKKRFFSRGVHFDDQGRIWAQRSMPDGAAAAVDMFDAGGEWRATYDLPAGSVVHRASCGRLLVSRIMGDDRIEVVDYLIPR